MHNRIQHKCFFYTVISVITKIYLHKTKFDSKLSAIAVKPCTIEAEGCYFALKKGVLDVNLKRYKNLVDMLCNNYFSLETFSFASVKFMIVFYFLASSFSYLIFILII